MPTNFRVHILISLFAKLLYNLQRLGLGVRERKHNCYGIGFFKAIPGFFVVRARLLAIRSRFVLVSLVIPSLPHKHYVSLFYKKRCPIYLPQFSSRISLYYYYNILSPPPLKSHLQHSDSRALPNRQAYYPTNQFVTSSEQPKRASKREQPIIVLTVLLYINSTIRSSYGQVSCSALIKQRR